MDEFSKEQLPQVSTKPTKKLTRRDFLELSLAAVITAPFAIAKIEQTILKAFSSGLMLPGATDRMVSVANSATEIGQSSENQTFRPVYEIIKEGINNFETKTGKKAFYQRSKDYKEFVERKKMEPQNPISSSGLLEYYLEKNSGDLAKSVYDTAIFLKFMARSDLKTGKASYDPSTVKWFQENIKDEHKGPSYQNSADNKTLINLVGKPYHSWNLIALIAVFPVEFIHAAGVYRQLVTLRDQGIDKTKADLQTLQDLRKTEEVFLSYPPVSSK